MSRLLNKKRLFIILLLIIISFCSYYFARGIKHEITNIHLMRKIDQFINPRKEDFRRFFNKSGYRSEEAYIAHGGGIGKFTYTNSMEAVMDSIKKRFRFIEIDLLKTSDGHLLGAHDWKHFKTLTSFPDNNNTPLTLDEAMQQKIKGIFSPLDGNSIRKIMENNPDIILVTDKIADYDLILKEIPFPERMIVEVFSPEDYLRALQSGIRYPAYCIWGVKQYQIATRFKFPIVTMSARRMLKNDERRKMVQNLHNKGVTILLFGTGLEHWDKETFVREHVGKTVSKIYTDRHAPSDIPQ